MLKSYNLWPSHKMSFSLCLLLWMHAVYDTKTVKVHLSIHPSLAQFRVIGEGVGGGCVYPSWNRVRGSLYPEELLTSKAVNCLGLQASGRPSLRAGKLQTNAVARGKICNDLPKETPPDSTRCLCKCCAWFCFNKSNDNNESRSRKMKRSYPSGS